MSHKNPVTTSPTPEFVHFNRGSRPFLSKSFLAASAILAMSLWPMSDAQAAVGAVPGDAWSPATSESDFNGGVVERNYDALAIVVKPEKDRTPPDGGDGDKPKRPERRAVVSVHG